MSTRTRHATAVSESCDLCGARVGLATGPRWRHLWRVHHTYATGLLLRLVAPAIFVGLVAAIGIGGAPVWLLFLALGGCVALVGIGVARSSAAKRAAGSPDALRFWALVRAGGFRVLLLGFVCLSLLVLALRR